MLLVILVRCFNMHKVLDMIQFCFGIYFVILIYLDYLLSGILITIFNKCFHLKASGHSCGIVGPVAMLIYFGLYIPAAIGALLTILVFISSIKMKRHTFLQLLGGSAITISALLILLIPFEIIL